MMDIIVRSITCDDIDNIIEIEKLCFADIWSKKNIEDSLSNPRDILLCVEYGGNFAGYIFADFVLDEVNINRIAINPRLRKIGLASCLLRYLEQKVSDFAVQIMLEVRKSNLQAQNLYLKNGYNKVGERKRFYTNPVEDAVLMKKFLNKVE